MIRLHVEEPVHLIIVYKLCLPNFHESCVCPIPTNLVCSSSCIDRADWVRRHAAVPLLQTRHWHAPARFSEELAVIWWRWS